MPFSVECPYCGHGREVSEYHKSYTCSACEKPVSVSFEFAEPAEHQEAQEESEAQPQSEELLFAECPMCFQSHEFPSGITELTCDICGAVVSL